MQAYSDSKLHDAMLAFELAARHPNSSVNTVDPGWIKTRLGGPDAWDPVEDGAETQVWLATSDDEAAKRTGRYVKRREELEPNPAVRDAAARGVRRRAVDQHQLQVAIDERAGVEEAEWSVRLRHCM